MPGGFSSGFSSGFGSSGSETLSQYTTDLRRLLHDPNGQYYSTADLTAYINEARQKIALDAQCCRLLLSGGVITGLTLANAGSGYSNPTLSFVGAGFQAKATITQIGGVLQTPTLVYPGWGYVTGATVTIADGAGVNGSVTATTDQSLTTVAGQEIYTFSTANGLATLYPGIQQITGVMSVAISWGSMKPMLEQKIWSEFQAYLRSYNTGLQNFPTIWSQYGQGQNGTIYLWPIPSTASQMDWDVWCAPIPLVDDTTFEAIPYPWTIAVKFYAAYLAYDNSQRAADSDRMFERWERYMKELRAGVEAPFVPSYYGNDGY